MKCSLKLWVVASLALALAAGCARPAAQTSAPEPTALQASPAASLAKGTVIETMDSGGYTYLCIENAGQKRWAAIPQTEIRVGEQVELMPGNDMTNFTSKSLNRTFESILFCPGVVREGEAPARAPAAAGAASTPGPAGHAMPAAPASAPHGMAGSHKMGMGMAGPAAGAPIAGTVVETMDAGGYTYLNVEQDGQRTWVAVPAMKASVGDQIQLSPGMVMKNFTSKTLNRTFESIVFSSGPVR